MPPKHFGLAISEYVFSSSVERQDCPLKINGDDTVDDVVQHRFGVFGQLSDLDFGLPVFGHVKIDAGDPCRAFLVIEHHPGHTFDDTLTTGLVMDAIFVLQHIVVGAERQFKQLLVARYIIDMNGVFPDVDIDFCPGFYAKDIVNGVIPKRRVRLDVPLPDADVARVQRQRQPLQGTLQLGCAFFQFGDIREYRHIAVDPSPIVMQRTARNFGPELLARARIVQDFGLEILFKRQRGVQLRDGFHIGLGAIQKAGRPLAHDLIRRKTGHPG